MTRYYTVGDEIVMNNPSTFFGRVNVADTTIIESLTKQAKIPLFKTYENALGYRESVIHQANEDSFLNTYVYTKERPIFSVEVLDLNLLSKPLPYGFKSTIYNYKGIIDEYEFRCTYYETSLNNISLISAEFRNRIVDLREPENSYKLCSIQ